MTYDAEYFFCAYWPFFCYEVLILKSWLIFYKLGCSAYYRIMEVFKIYS